jgi:hypothetical protein
LAKNIKKDDITCDIQEVYGTLSDNGYGTRKIFAKVSWNGLPAKPEIRTVRKKADGEEVVGKGIALTDDEMDKLILAYRKKKASDDKNKPVNFQNIFNAAPGIIDKREEGHVTKNGYIILQETGELAERAKSWKKKNRN